MNEVYRMDVTDNLLNEGPTVKVDCDKCGKVLVLFFNGGELDMKDCCGITYELEHSKIDLVVKERQA